MDTSFNSESLFAPSRSKLFTISSSTTSDILGISREYSISLPGPRGFFFCGIVLLPTALDPRSSSVSPSSVICRSVSSWPILPNDLDIIERVNAYSAKTSLIPCQSSFAGSFSPRFFIIRASV